jgi:hypothetical protein
MDEELFQKMLGEWVGTGTTKFSHDKMQIEAKITEYLNVEATDRPNSFSYIRRSRIIVPATGQRPEMAMLHNELGYMRTDGIGLLLSRDSSVNLEWKANLGYYFQINGQDQSNETDDTRNMSRKVEFPTDEKMIWDAAMQVLDSKSGDWGDHTAFTTFDSFSRAARL